MQYSINHNNELEVFIEKSISPLNLGGLLVTRQTVEMIIQIYNLEKICNLYIKNSPNSVNKNHSFLTESVFKDSVVNFSLTNKIDLGTRNVIFQSQGSPYSMKGVTKLFEKFSLRPQLMWKPKSFDIHTPLDNCFGFHFKFLEETEFGHKVKYWIELVEYIKKLHPRLKIIILGNNAPEEIRKLPSVMVANDKFSLSDQLYLCQKVKGFLGIASGFCTAAQFSNTPHVIFKHPKHDTDEMDDEMGNSDKFPFAKQNQRLWRVIQSKEILFKAFSLINEK